MGLCTSKVQQLHDDSVTGKPMDSDQQADNNKVASSSSPLPSDRPASTESGQAAAAAGDGVPSPLSSSGGRNSAAGTPSAGAHTATASTDQAQQQTSSADGGPTSPAAAPHSTTANGILANGTVVAGAVAATGAVSAAGQGGSTEQQQQQSQQRLLPRQPATSADGQPTKQWDRAAGSQTPSALASSGSSLTRPLSSTSRSVKFADTAPESEDGGSSVGDEIPSLPRAAALSKGRRPQPRRSISSSALRSTSGGNEVSEAILAKQAEILRSNKTGKLRLRRGGLDSSFAALQDTLTQDGEPIDLVATRAAGLKHIGFGPFKRENQDEFFIQVGDFGGVGGGNLFCVFDGHGTHGKDAALYSRQLLPRLLDVELRKYFQRVGQDSEAALRGAVEVLITEVFGDTERSLANSGVNLANSGTTATVAFQRGNRLWVAAAGDSRAIVCTRNARDQWRALPLTIDHRPRRTSERERIEAAGARVAPKRLPSGRSVGEPRLWLQESGGPGLLLSRSLGDLTAATVGCTSDPEVTYTTLRPHTDQVLVMATDGVWDVLTNEQVCDIVVESPDPHIACRRVLDAALYEWEERMSADNITVLVVEFEWNEDGAVPVAVDHAVEHASAVAAGFRPVSPGVP